MSIDLLRELFNKFILCLQQFFVFSHQALDSTIPVPIEFLKGHNKRYFQQIHIYIYTHSSIRQFDPVTWNRYTLWHFNLVYILAQIFISKRRTSCLEDVNVFVVARIKATYLSCFLSDVRCVWNSVPIVSMSSFSLSQSAFFPLLGIIAFTF